MKQLRVVRRAGIVAVSLAAFSLPAQAQKISAPGGGGTYSPFGNGWSYVATFGQTFTAPAALMKDYSFWLGESLTLGGAPLNFRGYVYAWNDGTHRATGSALFSSAVMSGPEAEGFTKVTVNTGITLTPGQMYVAFLSTSDVSGAIGFDKWSESTGNTYAGGEFVYQDNGDDRSHWTTQSWGTDVEGCNRDAQFEMNFGDPTATPEPITMSLLGTGLVGLAALRRRRRQEA